MAGWEDFNVPAGQPASATGWESLNVPAGGTPPPSDRVKDIGDAITYGLQSSSLGLAIRGKLPAQQLGEEAPWYHRLAATLGSVGGDLPLAIPSMAVGGVAGTAVGGPGVGTAVGAGAGGFAVPMALREALVDAYTHNYATSWEGVWEIAKSAMLGAGKGALIGGATLGAGKVAAPLLAPAGKVLGGAATLGVELSTLTATSAAVQGHMPTWQDFMDNAILLGGLKGAGVMAHGMMDVFKQTGKLPSEILADAKKDPSIVDALRGKPFPESKIPDIVYHGTTKAFDKHNVSDTGLYFTSDPKYADIYTRQEEGGNIRPVYLDVKNPLVVKSFLETADMTPARRADLEKQGYDAVMTKDGAEIVVFHPEQVRGQFELPPYYKPLALEERIKASLDADPRPEALRQLMGAKEPPKLGDPPIQDPVKYEHITDQETLQGVLRATEGMYQKEIDAQTRGEVSNKQTAAEALKLITSGDIAEHVIGSAENAAAIYARGHILKGVTKQAFDSLDAIRGIDPASLRPRDKLQALAAIEQLSMTLAEFRGARAEAGRALQIFQKLYRDSSMIGEAEAIVRAAERKGNLQDIARLAAKLKDPAQMQTFAEGYTKATTVEKVLEAWKAGILSGPQTHMANIMGNVTKWLVELPESVIAASITAGMRAAKGDPLTMSQYKARALAPLYGIQLGGLDALKVAGEVWNQKGEHLEKADVYRTAIEGKKGEIIRIPFRLLQVVDSMFRTTAERAQAHIMATDRVAKEGLHMETAEAREKIVKYTNDPTFGLDQEAGNAAVKKIQEAGAEAVFSQRLGPRLETLQRAMQGHPIGFVIPFFRTPVNLISWAIQHTPGLNLLSGRWRADFMEGGEGRARALARITVGSAISLTAYSLAQDGLITGGGLFDKEQRGTKSAAGVQPYSFKIGDKYYSYQRLEPVAKVIGLAADLIEMMKATKDDEDKAKIATGLVLVFGNATVSTTYMSGISNVLNGVTDPSRYGQALVEQYASSVVPKLIGQTAALIDPNKREVDGAIDAIQAQIPFLREKLMSRRDVWGEPAKNNKWFEVLPVATSEASHDKVRTEAARLAVAIADAPDYAREQGPLSAKEQRIPLTPEQLDKFRQTRGSKAMEWLSPLVNSQDWNHIPDYAKAAIIRRAVSDAGKLGQYAALPPDDAKRVQMREKIINEIIKQTQEVK